MTKQGKKQTGRPDLELSGRTWVVVADGRQARVFRKDKSGAMELLDKIVSTRDHHLKHNPPHIDAIHPDDAAFIREVGGWLEDHSEGGSFDKFVLVASPRHLPHFKKAFSKPLQARMGAEVDKELAHLEDHAVCKELCDMMWF